MSKFLLPLLALFYGFNAFAGCGPEYQRKINEISGKMNPPRTTVIANIGAEAVVVGTLASVGTLTVGAVVALPAAAIGAGTYLAVLAEQRREYVDVKLTLDQAQKGSGPHWSKFLRKVSKHTGADEESIRNALLRLDSEQAFCHESDQTGKIQLAKPRRVRMLVASELH